MTVVAKRSEPIYEEVSLKRKRGKSEIRLLGPSLMGRQATATLEVLWFEA